MTRKHLISICIICVATLFASCVKDGDVVYIEEDNEADVRPIVYFICGDDKMGDLTYFDAIYRGIMDAANKYDLLISLGVLKTDTPSNLEQSIGDFIKSIKIANTQRKTLVVLGNDSYESILHEYENELSKISNIDFLLIESRDSTLPVNTIYFSLYGACYQAGRVVSSSMSDVKDLAIISANKKDSHLTEMRNGFIFGLKDGGNRIKADSIFLADDSKGYNMADSVYRYSYALDSSFQMVLPLCGGTTQGFLRYNREHKNSFYTIGIDSDMQLYSSRVPFTIVKHLYGAVKNWIYKWMDGAAIPQNLYYVLESGYTEVVVTDATNQKLQSAMQENKPIAITKENDYTKFK